MVTRSGLWVVVGCLSLMMGCSNVKQNDVQGGDSKAGQSELQEAAAMPTITAAQHETDQQPQTAYSANPTEPSVVSYTDFNDPLEKINRPIFRFNHVLYRYALTPVSKGYQYVIPKPARSGVSNVFGNLREPLNFVNNLLQLRIADSGKNLARFGVNSTIGLLGLFDPANSWMEIEDKDARFSDTLSHYGVGYGAYIVIPVLGPSDLRSGTDYAFDYFAHPLNNISDKKTGQALLIYEGFHNQVPTLVKYPDVVASQKSSKSGEGNEGGKVDLDAAYEFVRNLHLQQIQRDAQARREGSKIHD